MTIRPHGDSLALVCDGPDCDHARPVDSAADITWACERIGWRRICADMEENLRPVVGHRCPRCAAIATAPPPAVPKLHLRGLA